MNKKHYTFICLFFVVLGFFPLVSCSNSTKEEDIVFSYIDEKAYAIYQTNTAHWLLYDPISFNTYDNADTDCPSRSYNYVHFNVKFNITPSGYKASEIFKIKSIKIDNKDCNVESRQGKTNKDIEILVVFQYNIEPQVKEIKSITYSLFDSVKGEDVEKTADLNYKFTPQTIPNWINRFNPETKFDIVEQETEDRRYSIAFTVDTNIEYNSLLYNVNQQGVVFYEGQYKAVISEEEYAKSAVYKYENEGVSNYTTKDFIVVGYVKNGIKYYFSPIHFLMYKYN